MADLLSVCSTYHSLVTGSEYLSIEGKIERAWTLKMTLHGERKKVLRNRKIIFCHEIEARAEVRFRRRPFSETMCYLKIGFWKPFMGLRSRNISTRMRLCR
jgi:hypothetical protein